MRIGDLLGIQQLGQSRGEVDDLVAFGRERNHLIGLMLRVAATA